MATFTFTGQLFDLVENADGSAASLSARSADLVITTSEDIGFFTYRYLQREGALRDIDVTGGNVTSVTVNGANVFQVDSIDSSLGVITINGQDSLTLALTEEEVIGQVDLAIFALDGADLPAINVIDPAANAAFREFILHTLDIAGHDQKIA